MRGESKEEKVLQQAPLLLVASRLELETYTQEKYHTRQIASQSDRLPSRISCSCPHKQMKQ
jgi:hypothetical protein